MGKQEAPLTFESEKWGTVTVHREKYTDGSLAVSLTWFNPEDQFNEPLAKLSANMEESSSLPENCFYMKDWSENTLIAAEAQDSGLFKRREDIPNSDSGWVSAQCWEIL